MVDDPSPNPLRSVALRALRWSALRNWLSQGIGIGVVLVLARLLSPADFGAYSIGSSLIFVAAAFADQGLTTALTQREKIDDLDISTVFWASQLLAVLLCAGLWIAAGDLAAFFNAPDLSFIVPAIAITIPLMAASAVISATLIRELNFKAVAAVSIWSVLTSSLATIALAFLGFGIWSLLAQALVGNLIGLLLFIRISKFRPKLSFSFERIQNLWTFSLMTLVGDLLSQLNQRLPVFLIGVQLSPQQVGIFSVGRRFVDLGQQAITGPIAQVTIPAVAKIQSDMARARPIFLNGLQVVAALVWPVMALGFIFSSEIVSILLGPSWQGAGPIIALLAIAGIFECLHWFCASFMIALGRAGIRLALTIVNLLTIMVAIGLASSSGLETIALALAWRSAIVIPLIFLLLRRVLPVKLKDIASTLGALLPAFGIFCAVAAVIQRYMVEIPAMLAVPLGSAAAGLAYWAVASFTLKDLQGRLIDILPIKIRK